MNHVLEVGVCATLIYYRRYLLLTKFSGIDFEDVHRGGADARRGVSPESIVQ